MNTTNAYLYTARDANGKAYSGLQLGETKKAAWNQLADRGLCPSALNPVDRREPWLDVAMNAVSEWPSAMRRARSTFWRLVRQHARRGREPVEAIIAYLPECESTSPRFAAALRDMLLYMTMQGQPFGAALSRHPKEIPYSQVALIEATEGKDARLLALDSIIADESNARQSGAANIAERLDAYLTDIVAVGTLAFIAKWFIPQFATVTTAALGHAQGLTPLMDGLNAAGNLVTSWTTYFLVAGVVLIARAFYDYVKTDEDVAIWLEEQRWRIPTLKQSDLTKNRMEALKLVASLRHAGTDEQTIFESIIKASASPQFRKALKLQRDSVPNTYSFEESFSYNTLWGGEISSLFAASKAGTWNADAREVVQDLQADYASQLRVNNLTVTYIHYAASFLITAGIVTGIFVVQLVFTLALARS
jgi:type II secretory pathway component PulF